MSPFNTLKICGNSSKRTARINLPTGVTRASLLLAKTGPDLASAVAVIERNL